MKMLLAAAAATLCFGLTSAQAGTVTSTSGDRDCFGLGGACADGDHYRDDLGGVFFADNSGPGDPVGTDRWDVSAALGGPSFAHTIALGGAAALTASMEIFIAGPDLGTGATFLFNGTSIGSHLEGDAERNRAQTLMFNVPVALLIDGVNTLALTLSDSGDGFIVDYTELTVETSMNAVPAPAALPLLASGLGLMGFMGWRRKKA